MVKSLEKLVEEFAYHVQAQTKEIFKGDAKTGNKHAKKAVAAFLELRSRGDTGRDALAVLFTHPSMDVRTSAAAFLLRHRTAEAKAVLEEAAKGKGLIPFEASEALKRWEEGTWALDPAGDEAEQPDATRPAPPPSKRSRPRPERATTDRRRGSKRDKPGSRARAERARVRQRKLGSGGGRTKKCLTPSSGAPPCRGERERALLSATQTLDAPAFRPSVLHVVRRRCSSRRFLPTPIPRELLVEALSLAQLAPSNSNIQPWRLFLAEGERMERLREALLAEVNANPRELSPLPASFRAYRRELGTIVYGAMGVSRDDEAGREKNVSILGLPF